MHSHSFLFFDVAETLHVLPKAKRSVYKSAFAKYIRSVSEVAVDSYGTLGFKAGTRFMFHVRGNDALALQKFTRDLLHTELGAHLRIAHALFGIRRASPYNPKDRVSDEPLPQRRYLIVYPFTKTIQWHLLPHEERAQIMKDHVAVGKKYSEGISQLLLYSYGLDDQEFIVSYATDSLADFQTLVMELRRTEARRYTERDTPIFLCTRLALSETLLLL